MTDDYAIEGSEGGYVPCFELPAVLVVEEEGAISGHAGGRVPRDNAAGSLPAPERAAIVGSAVGYVAAPCCVDGRQILIIDTFGRVVGAGWGTATSPDYTIALPAGAWTKDPIFGATTEDVDGDNGNSANPGGASAITHMILPLPQDPTWFEGKDWMECRWLVSTTVGNCNWRLQNASGTKAAWWSVKLDGSGMQFGRFQSGINTFNVLNGAPINLSGDPFWIALRLDWLASTIEMKRWADGDTEPVAWESTVTGMALTAAEVDLTVHVNGQSGPAGVTSTDYIEATVPC